MATDARRSLPDLVQRIMQDAPAHEFFQLVRVMESVWGRVDDKGGKLDEKVRLRPAREIGFPPADVRRVVRHEHGPVDVQLNFMGLYGVDAPVPQYFIQTVLRNDDAGEITRAFLDIFSHRFYMLLYQAWKKYRPAVDMENPASRHYDYLAAIAGFRNENPDSGVLRFSGLYARRSKSATGLMGLVEEATGVQVEVQEFLPRWIKVETEARLGGDGDSAMTLGDNAILGEQILDVSAKIHIHTDVIEYDQAMQLLPGKKKGRLLGEMIQRYLDGLIDFEIALNVSGAVNEAPALGDSELRLGWRSWLGNASGEQYSIQVSGDQYTQPGNESTVKSVTETQSRQAA